MGLRARIAISFALLALAVAGALAGLAYERTRTVLLDDRQDAAVVQTFVNARLVRDTLRSEEAIDVRDLLASLSTANRSEPRAACRSWSSPRRPTATTSWPGSRRAPTTT